ncbi:winged-helix domain-containing protein [Mannheimia massilioguelmaensis]|uniref:VpaChn25_0724 family phage protein n=1 Tax=Mannheimia massilioguelmaensis TaxID=1604354 RepID=UPI0005C92470|nr:winged-helix domain-containing protein [Mannheimia massilioguelmaensis]
MALKELLTQDQRLVILRSLAEAGYDANESIISDCLDLYGHDISRDLVRNHLNWLEEQGLVTVQRLESGYMVASITQRGLDVAQGRTFVDGVKRPRPKI